MTAGGYNVRDIVLTLVGAVLERREPQGDAWDRLKIHGVQEFEGGVLTEVVVSPVDTFESPIHVDIEALNAGYEIAQPGQPPKDWSTDPTDVLLRRDSTVTDATGPTRVLQEQRQQEAAEVSPRVEEWKQQNPIEGKEQA